jgi:excisionase family DNA binding protein
MNHEQLLTVEEVAQEMRVHEKTVRKWIKDKELIAIDVGREYRIRRVDLEDFKRRRQTSL